MRREEGKGEEMKECKEPKTGPTFTDEEATAAAGTTEDIGRGKQRQTDRQRREEKKADSSRQLSADEHYFGALQVHIRKPVNVHNFSD